MAMFRSEGNVSLKNPVTPPGIDPRTFRLVAQRLNHYATPGPSEYVVFIDFPQQQRLNECASLILYTYIDCLFTLTNFSKNETKELQYYRLSPPLIRLFPITYGTLFIYAHTHETGSRLLLFCRSGQELYKINVAVHDM